jgi:hypothetical protein
MSNLLGPRIRDGVVKACNARAPSLPWEQMIETVCENVTEKVREGRPAVLLADVPITESLDWRLYPLLYEKAPTVLFGLGGSLKSYLSAWIAVRVALGIDCEPGNVLVLDWESEEEDWKRRVLMVSEGLDCGEPPNITYRYCASPLPVEIEEVRNLAHGIDAGLVIVDSAAYACGGEPEKAEPTMEYFRALRELECTSLTIAHQNSDKDTKKPYGNVYWTNSPRSTIQVIRSDDDSETVAEIGLYQRKRNYSKWKPLGYRATFQTASPYHWTQFDRVTFQEISVTEMPDQAANLPISQRVIAALRQNARMTFADFIEEMPDVNEGSLRTIVHRMRQRGTLVELAGYAFGLAERHESEAI